MDLNKRLNKIQTALERYDASVRAAFERYDAEMRAIKEELRGKKLDKVRRKIYGNGK